jgi:hypothetical protein
VRDATPVLNPALLGVKLIREAKRCGHDPAVLLRFYAKRTRKADESAAGAIAALSKGVL